MNYQAKQDRFTKEWLVVLEGPNEIILSGTNGATAEWIAESFNKMLVEENL